jgi:hypothetical protein
MQCMMRDEERDRKRNTLLLGEKLEMEEVLRALTLAVFVTFISLVFFWLNFSFLCMQIPLTREKRGLVKVFCFVFLYFIFNCSIE